MAAALSVDSTFLVDLEREHTRGGSGPAHDFLAQNADSPLFVSTVAAGELACGRSAADRSRWERMLLPYRLLSIDARVAWEFGQAFRFLQANGLMIGSNDLWIAATALASELPVVTRNRREFARVPGLTVLGYD